MWLYKGHFDSTVTEPFLSKTTETERPPDSPQSVGIGFARPDSMAFYQEFFDNLAVGAYRTTPNGQIEHANSRLAEILGYTSVERLIEANSVHFYVDLEDRKRWQKEIERAPSGKPVCFKTQWRRLDGRHIHVKNIGRAIRSNKLVIGYEGVVLDVTDQLVPLPAVPGRTPHNEEAWSDAVKERLPICISRKNRDRKITWANEMFRRSEGVTMEELLDRKNTDAALYGPELDELYRISDEKVFETGRAYSTTENHRSADGLMRTVQVVKLPVFGKDRHSVEGVEVCFWNDPDPLRGVAQLELARQRAERFENLLRSQYNAYYEHDLNCKLHRLNDALAELTGRGREEMLGMNYYDLVAPGYVAFAKAKIQDQHKNFQERSKDAEPPEDVASYELDFLHKDGHRIPVEINSRLVVEQGKAVGLLGYVRDLTARRQAEQSRIKEIHHRVKNSLHTINGLLENAQRTANEQTYETLMACRQRVLAIAQIHEQLYRVSGLDRIDAKRYVQELTDRLFRTYKTPWQRITPRVTVEGGIYLSLDALTPCALVLHEMISNALKHAFPPRTDKFGGERGGTVFVSLTKRGSNRYCLQLSDTGVGMPAGFDRSKSRSLGLTLIYGLIEKQLKGQVELDTGPSGTSISAIFTDPGSSEIGEVDNK